jgi:sugar-phosphatase
MVLPSLSSQVEIQCQGVLFDMDGVLISSIDSVERSWRKWATGRGLDPAHALSIVHGCRAEDTMRKLGLDIDLAVELKVLEDLEVADQVGVRALDGVLELIQTLPRERWTVVTSATGRLARTRLAAAGIVPPERMISGDDVAEGKPNPAPYLAGAALLGVRPEECVVLEDSFSGVAAGRAAGCTVIATTFTHPAEDLTAAHYLLHDVTGVRVEQADAGLTLRLEPLATRG